MGSVPASVGSCNSAGGKGKGIGSQEWISGVGFFFGFGCIFLISLWWIWWTLHHISILSCSCEELQLISSALCICHKSFALEKEQLIGLHWKCLSGQIPTLLLTTKSPDSTLCRQDPAAHNMPLEPATPPQAFVREYQSSNLTKTEGLWLLSKKKHHLHTSGYWLGKWETSFDCAQVADGGKPLQKGETKGLGWWETSVSFSLLFSIPATFLGAKITSGLWQHPQLHHSFYFPRKGPTIVYQNQLKPSNSSSATLLLIQLVSMTSRSSFSTSKKHPEERNHRITQQQPKR